MLKKKNYISDEKLSDDSDYEFVSEDGKNLEDTIADITKELSLDMQITDGMKHLEERFLALEG